jgi:hypothetical protein
MKKRYFSEHKSPELKKIRADVEAAEVYEPDLDTIPPIRKQQKKSRKLPSGSNSDDSADEKHTTCKPTTKISKVPSESLSDDNKEEEPFQIFCKSLGKDYKTIEDDGDGDEVHDLSTLEARHFRTSKWKIKKSMRFVEKDERPRHWRDIRDVS